MMNDASYLQRRGQLETYFDRTAAEAWARLTSTAKVSHIRETVRAGRDRMRQTLLAYLPADLRGKRLLDAGCGTGALAIEAARRGAKVTAIDLSANLVQIARERIPADIDTHSIDFRVGDMLDPPPGRFDHVVCMDSLIHYRDSDIVDALERLGARTDVSVLITFAPKTALLTVMHTVGLLFPRADRAPAIVPVGETNLRRLIASRSSMNDWETNRTDRIKSGFYTSQALELRRQ